MAYFRVLFLLSTVFFIAACGNNSEIDKEKEKEAAKAFQNKAERFLDSLNKVIVENPNNLLNFEKRATFYLEKGDLELALNDVNRLLAIDSTKAKFVGLKADLLFQQSKFDEAKVYFERAVKLDPNYTIGYNKLAELEFFLRNYKNALQLLDKSLMVDQNQAVCYTLKGHIFREVGDSASSASSFKTAVEINPNDYNSFIMLARLYETAKNKDISLAYYNTAIDLRPNLVEPIYGKAYFLQKRKLYQEAIATYNQLIEVDSLYPLSYYNKGFIYLTVFDSLNKAVNQFSEAILRKPDYTQAYYNRGLAYEFKKVLDSAETDYRRALVLQPQFDNAALGLDRVLKSKKKR